MAESVLLTGATGTLGARVLHRLTEADLEVRVFTRHERPPRIAPEGWVTGDLTTGAGLDRALDGVSTIVHCATDAKLRSSDTDTTRRLVEAARRAGSPHLVYISIVGVDRVPLAYYRAKLAAERVVQRSGLPWTLLRATQFHELLYDSLRRFRRWPLILVPARTRFQPVAADEVAARLVELVAAPAGRVPDLGGPEVRTATDLARVFRRVRREPAPVVPVWLPGAVGRAYRQGHHLATGHPTGQQTWDQFLAGRPR
jgi:uncharacterized protein YbjT (DUF2867 family)